MSGRCRTVLAKRLIHCSVILALEHAARIVLDDGGDSGVQCHARLQAVRNVLVQDGGSAVALFVAACFVGLGEDVVELLLPVDRQLDRPQPEALGQLQAAMVYVSNARVVDGDATDECVVLPRVQVQHQEVVIVSVVVSLHGFENARLHSYAAVRQLYVQT